MNPLLLQIAFVIFLLVLIAFIYLKLQDNRFSQTYRKFVFESLKQIQSKLDNNNPEILRDCVVRLDSIFSKLLNRHFSNNESCGQNLKRLRTKFDKKLYNNIWEVHKLRNSIVHDNMDVTQSEAKEAYRIYKSAINIILR